jgi:hypothetical protein
MIRLSDYVCWWFIVCIIYQAGVSFYLDSSLASVINHLFLIIFFILALFKLRFERNQLKSIFLFSFLFLSIFVNLIENKSFEVLMLGMFDNMKFLLLLLIVIIIPKEIWSISNFGNYALNTLFYIIILSIIFGVFQQISTNLIYIFPSSEGFKEQYRYEILRVPSIFAYVNAFAKVSFLLIPLAVLQNKNIKIAIIFACLGFIIAFSRQFILGLGISFTLAYLVSGHFNFKRIISFFLLVTTFVSAIALTVYNTDNDAVDSGLLNIPERYIRTAVAITSIKATVDNPFFGVGPGYFGGNIGKKYGIDSELNKYGLTELVPFFDLTDKYYTDTLWPQLLAEYGLIGFSIIIFFFYQWYQRLVHSRVYKFKLVALICFFQFIFVGFVSPVFNYLYFSVPILFLTMFLANKKDDNRY